MSSYEAFLAAKAQTDSHGFAPSTLPPWLFGFQEHLVEWALRQGRAAIFADCGLGKTAMQLAWADTVARKTDKPVLIATPLAVGQQTVFEAQKFGLEADRSRDGSIPAGARIVVTNYERLHLVDPSALGGMVCDESSILKNFDGVRRAQIQELMRTLPYRLLCTATAAPNDYIELGTSSEVLGELGHLDMLSRFFRNADGTANTKVRRFIANRRQKSETWKGWRFKGHAETAFWRWICSWSRACRRPSDLGFPDDGFELPKLETYDHIVESRTLPPGMLFAVPAIGLDQQREERRRTIRERCEAIAEIVDDSDQAFVLCHLNPEGDMLEEMIEGAVQVSGADTDEEKEERLMAFANGEIRVLVTKPKIGAWGLNLQGCAHVATFPSHSYEQYYQSVRRCWRFGQKRPVRVDVVATDGEKAVLESLHRKAEQADRMFSALVREMNSTLAIGRSNYTPNKGPVPAWIETPF